MLIELTIGLPDDAFQPGLDHAPFRAVDHDRHAGDVGLGGDQLQEGVHRLLGVEQALVHVDVDDLRAVLDLLARDLDRGGIVAGQDQLLEARRAGDVGALADIDEACARGAVHSARSFSCTGIRQQSSSASMPASRSAGGSDVPDCARRASPHRLGDCGDVRRRRAAAAADDVDQPFSAHSRTCAAVSPAASSYSPSSLGRPALG